MATLDFDYTKDSDLNDEMTRSGSPMREFKFTDNIAFQGQNEVDSFTPTLTSEYDAYTYGGNGGFFLIDAPSRVKIVSLTSDGLFFQNTNQIGAGNIFPFGTATIGINGDVFPGVDATWDLGSGGFQWNTIYLVNAPVVSSDRRLKSNIRDLDYGLEEVLQLKPSRFTMGGKEKMGLIAQDVDKVIPEVVENAGKENEMAGIRYQDLIPVLIKAVHDLAEENDSFRERIEDLEERLVV